MQSFIGRILENANLHRKSSTMGSTVEKSISAFCKQKLILDLVDRRLNLKMMIFSSNFAECISI